MAKDDLPMVETLVDLGRFLGMPVHPSPHLPRRSWIFGTRGEIFVSHDLWEELGIPTFDFELLTEVVDDVDDQEPYPQALAAE